MLRNYLFRLYHSPLSIVGTPRATSQQNQFLMELFIIQWEQYGCLCLWDCYWPQLMLNIYIYILVPIDWPFDCSNLKQPIAINGTTHQSYHIWIISVISPFCFLIISPPFSGNLSFPVPLNRSRWKLRFDHVRFQPQCQGCHGWDQQVVAQRWWMVR